MYNLLMVLIMRTIFTFTLVLVVRVALHNTGQVGMTGKWPTKLHYACYL